MAPVGRKGKVSWDPPLGWRIVIVDVEQTPEARSASCVAVLPTSAGFFPKAAGHVRQRREGASDWIVCWCLSGRGWCVTRGRRHEITPGDVLVLEPGLPHHYGPDESDPYTLRWFHCRGQAVKEMANALGATPRHPVVAVGMLPEHAALHEAALRALERVEKSGQLRLAAHLLGDLLARWTWEDRVWEHPRSGDQRRRVDWVIGQIRERLSAPWDRKALARLLGLSVPRSCVLFHQATGMPLLRWLTEVRLDQAASLLSTTSLSIKQVAGAVGYNDALYFSRQFRRRFGVSPKKIRHT